MQQEKLPGAFSVFLIILVRQGEKKNNMVEALPSLCTEFDAVAKDLPQSVNTMTFLCSKGEHYNNRKEDCFANVYEQRKPLLFGDM
jgi:hypothetical protein